MLSMDNLMNNKAVMLGLSVLAFLVAAALVIMIFRMLFGGRLRMPGGRARQARLGIVDAFDLDRQRQLIIVRRDNTEHLIMIGGPNDVVIESEIVRAELRDLRDQRRDAGTGDGRIPAPTTGLDKTPEKPPLQRPSEDPRLPMPTAAVEARADPTADMPRAPTFPLPPRRPASAPDRRPAMPPKLPDSVSRGEEVPAFSGQPAAPAPAPPAPMPPPAAKPSGSPLSGPLVAPPTMSAPPISATSGSSPAPPPPQSGSATAARPPFLKPLSPRPASRPLQRMAPQPPSVTPTAPPVAPMPNRSPALPRPESNDALESLEEEMAKLLGRGS